MSFTRKTLFGFGQQPNPKSQLTTRLVPLMGITRQDTPPHGLPPGSATSMSNFIPVGHELRVRSRLSSTLTTAPLKRAVGGFAELITQAAGDDTLWVASGKTIGTLRAEGGISVASFVSANGLGTSALSGVWFDFTTAYSPVIDNAFLVVASSSLDTLLAAWNDSSPLYSYITQAPLAKYVAAYDNYVVAFYTKESAVELATRVRWSDRGDPFAWTPGSSSLAGFEDLAPMSGKGTGLKVLSNRLILFSDTEIWVGVPSTYPSQFAFAPMDATMGCPYPRTIQNTPEGLVFLGHDDQLYLLAPGSSKALPIASGIADAIRFQHGRTQDLNDPTSWGVYNPEQRCYYLFLYRDGINRFAVFVVNLQTGTWGTLLYGAGNTHLTAGIAPKVANPYSFTTTHEPMVVGDSAGQVYYLSKTASADSNVSSGTVTAIWQSQPIGTDLPAGRHSVTQSRVGYRTQSLSTCTVRFSTDLGQTFGAGAQRMTLGANSVWSEAKADHYFDTNYPVMEIASESTGLALTGPVTVAFQPVGR